MPSPGKDLRWDGDPRGDGVASAARLAERLGELRTAAQGPSWVAEDPELHVWPRLIRAIEAEGSAWTAVRHTVDRSGTIEIELRHISSRAGRAANLRRDVLALVGEVVEGASYIEISDDPDGVIVVDVVTGQLDDQTPFRSHGHTLRFVITRSLDDGAEAGI